MNGRMNDFVQGVSQRARRQNAGRVAISLALLLVISWIISRFGAGGGSGGVEQPDNAQTLLNIGLLMLGAWLTGILFDTFALPRVSGYLIFGIVAGPYGLANVSRPDVANLLFARDLAIVLIALTAGGELNMRWLRGQLGKVSAVTLVEMVSVWILVGTAAFLVEPYVGLLPEGTTNQRIVLAVLTGLVAAANSPTVVMAMLSEYRAGGPLAKTTLAVTIFKDMLMVVVFATALSLGRGLADPQASVGVGFLAAVAVQLLGSIALGGLLGMVMAWYVHKVGSHLIVLLIGSCMLMALLGEQAFTVLGEQTHLEPLLLGLSAGIVMRNLWPAESEPLFHAVESMSLPVYCLFFALAGAKLNLAVMFESTFVIVVVIMFLIRLFALWGGVTAVAHAVKLQPEIRNKLWFGFVPQAGVSLALASLVYKAFPPGMQGEASDVANLLIGMIVLAELFGPIGFRHALLTAGKPQRE